MLLSEIIEQVLLESGEFIVGDITNINLDIGKFWLIVKRALAIYDKYKPVPRQMIITTTDSNYHFSPNTAPEYISRAYPSGFSYVNPFTIMSFQSGGEWPQIVYRYTKPVLYSSFSGQFEIMAHYNRTQSIIYSTSPVAASGSITFNSNPSLGDTFNINGTTWRFVSSNAYVGTQTPIKNTLSTTLASAVFSLVNSNDYNSTKILPSASSTAINLVATNPGTIGNSIIISASSGTTSGATLSGGVDGVIQDVDISDLDHTDVFFFDLVEALFMITLGKSRTAFTLPDMPVIMDAANMLQEGQQKYQEALQNIQESSRSYYAVGG